MTLQSALLPCPTPLQSPDTETAGAAFVTLMALMGDDAAASLSGAGAAANALLAVDSHFGLPAPVDVEGQALPACQLGCIPTDGQLMEALRANGYSPQPGRQQAQQQQQGAAAAAGGQQQGQEGDGPPKMQRIQTVKLILRTAAALCRYCAKASPWRAGKAWWHWPTMGCSFGVLKGITSSTTTPAMRHASRSRLTHLPQLSPPLIPPAAPGGSSKRAEPRGPVRPAVGGGAPGAGPSCQPAAGGDHRG